MARTATTTRVGTTARRAWLPAVALLGLAAGVQTVDPAIASVALVKASRDLGFNSSMQAFASSISTLALAASVIATGLMADRLGRRRIFVAALLTAAAGDLLVAVVPMTWAFLVGRATAGVGLGAVMACAFAYVPVVAGKDVGEALGLWAAMTMLTTLVGSLAGGILADTSWRAAFLFVPVACLLLAPLVLRMVPSMEPRGAGPVDVVGLVVVGLGMVSLLLGISRLATASGSSLTWLLLALGLVLFVAFSWWEHVSAHPVFPIRLFTHPLFIVAAVSGVMWNLAQAATTLQLSNLWQYVLHMATSTVSFGQLPLLAGAMLAAVFAGRALKAGVPLRLLLSIASFATAAGFVLLALVQSSTPYWYYVLPILVIGAATTVISVPQSQMFVQEAPKESYGPVTSSRTTVGQLGYALGMAGSTAIISALTTSGATNALKAQGASPSDVSEGLDAINAYVAHGQHPSDALAQQAIAAARDSYLHGFSVAMVVIAVLMVGLGALTLLLLRPAAAAASQAGQAE